MGEGKRAVSASSSPSETAAELEEMGRLRVVLKRSSMGLGFAASFVRVFSTSKKRAEREAVRRVLLGTPVETAFSGLAREGGSSGELLRFIAALARVSSLEASKGAERLSSMFDRWTLLKEKSAVEKKVMEFRGMIVSVVAGVVVGMLSSLSPLISSFQITLGSAPRSAPELSPYLGAVFLFPSVLSLGLFLSPRRPYLNVAASLAAFTMVVYFLGPLASFGLGG